MEPKPINILPGDGEAYLYDNFFSEEESTAVFDSLMKKINWEQQHIKLFGRSLAMPRLTAWYAEEGVVYTYSNLLNKPQPWIEELLLIKDRIEKATQSQFNSVLLNLYRSGNDSMGWHKDDEKELGKNPIIGSVSFGAERIFKFRHETSKFSGVKVTLSNGSFLLMKGATQHHWYHSVPKTKQDVLPRINLTFRMIKSI